MAHRDYQIPPERQRQFDLIEAASNATLLLGARQWEVP